MSDTNKPHVWSDAFLADMGDAIKALREYVPIEQRSWRHALLLLRIQELYAIPYNADGFHFFGGGVEAEINVAISAIEVDDLDECERWCVRAEQRSLRRYDEGFEPVAARDVYLSTMDEYK